MTHEMKARARRIKVTEMIDPPPPPPRTAEQKKFLMLLGVGISMIVIVGLYAAAFRQQIGKFSLKPEPSRWGVIKQEFADDLQPLKEQADGLSGLREVILSALKTTSVKANTIQILKGKIQSESATSSAQ